MKFTPGTRVRWATRDVEGTVLDDHAADFPDFIAIQWDNGDRTFSAPTHLNIQTVKDRDASPKSVTAKKSAPIKMEIPMNKPIKTPTTVRELGDLADGLGLTPMEVWGLIDGALGDRWWDHGLGEVTFTTQAPATIKRPSGYLREKGRKGTEARKARFAGPERVARGWILTPTWNAKTNQHAIEMWSAVDAKLTPADARKLAVALIEMADDVEAASTTTED
ncbi:hypothetical protein [Arthrobacter sp. A5]|uniref:hypothetical protein n=1 Tax=Arthrobacter sp. A5 TaxID=576926 RepID=UPI003DA8CFF9